MAITHVQAIGSNGSKSTGTTLAVTATPGTQPAVGDLIVVSCVRDDIANDPLTGDSVSDGHGNTYTRQTFAGGATGTNSTAGDSVNAVIFYCVLTVAWSSTTTVTWTHPSVTARGMQVEHFAGSAGVDIVAYGTTVTTNGSSTIMSPPSTGSPVPIGGLCLGLLGIANDTSTTTTGDADSTLGSWSTITSNAGTTGGTGNTNIYVATQYKLPTSVGIQTWNPTIGTSSSYVTALISFAQLAQTGIAFVGAGPQAASSTAASQTCTLAPNAATGDLLVIAVAGRPTDNGADGVTIAGGTDGWAQHGSTSYVAVAGTDDLSVQLWWKVHDGSESDPSVAVNTELAAAAATDRGYTVQMLAFRRVNTASPFDVTPVNSNTGSAQQTFAPTGVTTVTDGAMAVSIVATSDDNALNFNTAQGFTIAMGGADYDTAVGSDHAVGAAWKIITTASAVTEPTWNQSVNGNDQWVGLSTALRPPTAPADAAAAVGTAYAAAAAVSVAAAAGTGAATGAAYNATASISTAATQADAGSGSGTGTAYTPTLTILSAAAAGVGVATGSASDPAPTTSASASADTGAAGGDANAPGTAVAQPAGHALAVGAANAPTIVVAGSALAGTGTSAGTAYDAAVVSNSAASAGSASGTGSASDASTTAAVAANAGAASGAGTATTATVTIDIHAALSTTTGAAFPPSISAFSTSAADVASGGGVAYGPAVTVAAHAGHASAAGTADALAVTVDAPAGTAAAVGVADDVFGFTVNEANPDAFTFLVLQPSFTWARLD